MTQEDKALALANAGWVEDMESGAWSKEGEGGLVITYVDIATAYAAVFGADDDEIA